MYQRQFYDLHHARQYLSSSVVRIGNDPIIVQNVDGRRNDLVLYYCDMGIRNNEGLKAVRCKETAINYNPVELGYINFTEWDRKGACIGFRIPRRMWKVGLHTGNFQVDRAYDRQSIPDNTVLFNSSFLKNTIQNKYPSLNKVMKSLTEAGCNSKAFSRHFCVRQTGDLLCCYWRETPIGKVNLDNGSIKLNDEYLFLSELLQKDLK